MLSEKLEHYLEYIVVICFIVNNHSIWTRINSEKINFIILFISILLLMCISLKKLKITKKRLSILIIIITIISIYNFIFILLNKSNVVNFIYQFIVLLISFIIYSFYKIEKGELESILIKLSKLVVSLAVVSLFFYFLGSYLNIIKPSKYVVYEWGGVKLIPTYYNIYYQTQTTYIGGINVIRNSSIFNEPAIFASLLSISLCVEMFINKCNNKKNIIIIIISILTTFSTTGIILAGFLLFLSIIQSKANSNIIKSTKIFTIPIITICLLGGVFYFIGDKVNQSQNSGRNSYSVRMDDIRVGILAWQDRRLLGHGYNDDTQTKKYMEISVRGNDIGGSNGFMMILPQGGLYLLMLYVIPIVMSVYYWLKTKKMGIFAFIITLIMIVANNNIPYKHIIIYFISLAIVCNFNKTNIKNKI